MRKLNIIPTPRKIKYSEESRDFIPTGACVNGEYKDGLIHALALLGKDIPLTKSGNIKIYIGKQSFTEELRSKTADLFTKKHADKQGYYLKRAGACIVICAMTEIGAIYGIMTLLQICEGDDVPLEIEIFDYPDFLYRGNKWLSWAECGIWSYDRGDGIERYKERILRKLDLCLKYKINTVVFEAFGWRKERFEGYGALMRELNRKARALGIHLLNNAYGMGYGMIGHGKGVYQGEPHFNRESYPDGEIYKCIGTYDFGKPEDCVRGREYGTCLSNDSLMEEKLCEIREYLLNTEMGALYIHNMDADYVLEPLWKARCNRCRRKWPSDSLFSEDGAAGAFAYYIERLYQGIASVKSEHYDAEKECIVYIISPGYMYMHEDDEYFEIAKKFWQRVSELLAHHENLYIGFREHYYSHEGGELRFDALRRGWKNCDFACFDFPGGDGFYSDKLITGGALFLRLMRSSAAMIMENGNANQEPLQLLNAEYLWNSDASAYYNIPDMPKTYKELEPFYIDYLKTTKRPSEIYGEGGLLEIICEKLYGKEAAGDFLKLYTIAGEDGEAPLCSASSPEVYTHFTKAVFPMRWDDAELTENTGKINIDSMLKKFENVNESTKEASALIHRIYSEKKYFSECEEDIIWQRDNLALMTRYTDLLVRYMRCYKAVNSYFVRKEPITEATKEELSRIKSEAGILLQEVRASDLLPLCHLGGAMARREEVADFILYNTEIMERSIAEGSRIPSGLRPLKTREHW